jgi:hypothetical protein
VSRLAIKRKKEKARREVEETGADKERLQIKRDLDQERVT